MKAFSGCMTIVGCIVCGLIGLAVLGALSTPSSTSSAKTWGDTSTATTTPAPTPTAPPEGQLVLKKWGWGTSEYGTGRIQGRVVNKTGHDLSYAEIDFNLYDKSGAQVDTAMTNTTNLEAGATWKFEAVAMRGGEAKTARCVKLEGH
jgi:hypothetical protein